ncbi:MAG: hypothetical protein GX422_10045 [Deltaproteobacteria bacterium]|nr:hypothetical protein [Deltaproteobacteria bacterium]
MKDKRSAHLKVQEFCDCYATTDPLKEMSLVNGETDKEEGALKWIALAVLHGVNANAKSITLSKGRDGQVKVMAKYRKSELPSPSTEVAGKVIEILREITHIEESKGKTPFALGIREGSLDLKVKIEEKDGEETVSIKFPK